MYGGNVFTVQFRDILAYVIGTSFFASSAFFRVIW